MIVSWLFSERKQKKKDANRSTPCILVQNLGVLGKKNLQFFFLVLSPDAGEGLPGLLGTLSSFRSGGKGGEGLREEPAKTLLIKAGWGKLRRVCLVGSQGPPFWGWRSWRDGVEERVENWEILELMLVKRSGMCRIGGLGGCVLGAQRRKRNREGEGGQERLLAGELSEAAVSMCAGRVQRWEPPPGPPQPCLHRAAHRKDH